MLKKFKKETIKHIKISWGIPILFLMELDQSSIAIFLSLQNKDGKTIYEEMKKTLGDVCVSYSTINKYIRDFKYGFKSNRANNQHKVTEPDVNDLKILEVLDEYPFSSCRSIAKILGIPLSTVYYRLTHRLGFQNVHLKWVPHTLSDENKLMRVKNSIELLKILKSANHHSWNYFVTGDESWFEYEYNYHQKWIAPSEKVPQIPKVMKTSKKVMLTIFWNPHGFLVVDCLPKGETFNAHYYINNILGKLSQIGTGFPDTEERRLTVHADNARPHTAKVTTRYMACNGMKRAPHPPYSPDLAPSDFFLFGYIKKKLEGHSFSTKEELLEEVKTILANISIDQLKSVFNEWERRLKIVIHTDGEYITS